MKISVFPLILTFIVTATFGYLAYDIANKNGDVNDIVVGIGTATTILLTLSCIMGVSIKNSRVNVNLKVWSILVLLLMIVTNFCFASISVSMPYYIIIITLLTVIHLWMVWKLTGTNDV